MKKLISICLSAVMLLSLAACGNDISTSDSNKDKSTTTSTEVIEKGDNSSQTNTSETKEEEPAENDPDLLTVKINGVDITMDMDLDEFVEKTGLTIEQINTGGGYSVTDGYSTFFIRSWDNKLKSLTVMSPDSPEDAFVDTSKTEIIFPGGATLDTTRAEIQEIYPYKDNGMLTGSYAGSEEFEMWILKLEGYDYPGLTFMFENVTAEKPWQIAFLLQ